MNRNLILDKKHDLEAFRLATRTWLAENVPAPGWKERIEAGTQEEFVAFAREWLSRLDSVGLAAPHWPKQWGGEDLSTAHQIILCEEIAHADAPDIGGLFAVSLNHVPATLHAWGSKQQVERYVPGARQGTIWCQGFSEPNAGSDLASLRTRAERIGDKYVVNGQKIWSSFAHHAEYCLLLARTDPSAPKHKGISYFILDMKSKGLTIRPIHQINNDHEFCEVFFDQVEIPAENLIGEENNGWLIAQSTLSAERGMIIFELSERMQHFMQRLLRGARERDEDWLRDSQMRREFLQAYAELQSVRSMTRQMLLEAERTGELGDNPPYIKILYSEMKQRLAELILRMRGLETQIDGLPGLTTGDLQDKPMFDYVSSWAWTIAGGTNEIIRNIIAERLIGLPKEPRL